jgi:hypothetical protein
MYTVQMLETDNAQSAPSIEVENLDAPVDPAVEQFAAQPIVSAPVASATPKTRKSFFSFFQRTSKPKDTTPTVASINNSGTKPNFFKKHWKALSFVTVLLLILISVPVAVGLYTLGVVKSIEAQAQVVATSGRGALDQFKAQNLPGTEAELKKTAEELQKLKSMYTMLSFYKAVPFASAYYNDGEHGLNAAEAGMNAGLRAIASISPYADVLGFTGEGTFEGGAAENRIKLILDTLTKVTPELDAIASDLEIAQSELAQIDPNRYPEEFRGIAVRQQIEEGKGLIDNAATLLADYRPIIENLPKIAGANGERKKYLILFQNDNELRATGGFLTAYSVIFIENGVVTPEKSDDIYELDKKFNKRIAIPEALGRYLTTERYFNLRDMNTSPDFKLSMDQFYQYYQDLPGEPDNIDGIIAVDTHVLNELVRVVGPVQIPGYGTFSADNDPTCDCPQIIHALSEIITRPTPYIRQDRKGILAPLMQSILTRIYQSPRTFMADLFQVGLTSIDGRHVQMYFFDPELQTAAESINAAGRLAGEEGVQDFLAIVHANLGGAKSNLYVKYSVAQTVSAPEDGKITKSVEITYVNPRAGDNCNLEAGLLCLNSTLRDWTRIYLPPGSQLVDAQGFNDQPKQYEEGGFSVIDGFFILEPKSQAKVKLTYTVPYTDSEYKLKIWKQGGTDPIEHLIDINGGEELVIVNKDTVVEGEF